MSSGNGNKRLQRRKVLKSLGVAGGALAIPGTAAAKGDETPVPGKDEIDTSDWLFDIDLTEVSRKSVRGKSARPPETDIYVGPNKTVDASESTIRQRAVGKREVDVGKSDVDTENFSASATLLTWEIPDVVPVIGGQDFDLQISASVGWGGVSASLSVVVAGYDISIGGFNVSLGENEAEVSGKGTVYGVPFEVSATLEVSAGMGSVWNPDPELSVGAVGELCLGRDLCDEDASGWENVGCMLCASVGDSVTLL